MPILNNIVYVDKKLLEKQLLPPKLQKQLKIAVVGGSNSVMRSGYTKYLQESLIKETKHNIELSYFSLGGVTSLFGVIQNYRFEIAQNHDVILFEYCVNDRKFFINGRYTLEMAGMALEGFVRQAKLMNPNCIIILIVFGTNEPNFYNNCCLISAVYESIARRYEVPVINITELLLKREGLKFIKNLYNADDSVHLKHPTGRKIAGEVIAEQIVKHQLFANEPVPLDRCRHMYAANLQNLKFFSDFDALSNQCKIETSVFENSLFREEIYSISSGSSISMELKGRLLAIMINSDWYDGLIKIKFGKQELITSSFSIWSTKKGKGTINLLSLPYQKFEKSNKFEKLSISVCQEWHQNYELDCRKKAPVTEPKDWRLNIIGIAYQGKINLHTQLKKPKHMDNSQYNQTENSLKQAIKANPNNASYYQELGKIYQQQNQLDKAELVYKKAIEVKPEQVSFYKSSIEILITKKNFAGAALTCKHAIKLAPQDEELYSLLGGVLINLERLDLAEKCYLQAIKLNPQKAYYHRCLGDIFKQQQKFDLAISYYEGALAIAPKNPWFYIHLSEALIEQNKLEEANENCKQSLKFKQAKGVNFYRRVGDLQVKIGSFDDAIDTYKQAIRLNPNHNKKAIEQIRAQIDRAANAKECSQVS